MHCQTVCIIPLSRLKTVIIILWSAMDVLWPWPLT